MRPAPTVSAAKAKPGRDIPPIFYFGTINTFGQSAEHERITRAALACAPGTDPGAAGTCFQTGSLRQLAERTGRPVPSVRRTWTRRSPKLRTATAPTF